MTEFIRLNEKNCRDCYKCIRNCLIKAIRYSDGCAQIIHKECIQCGECLVTCPRHGRVGHASADAIRKQIRSGRRVVMSASPAFIADFDVGSIEDLCETLRQLGFYDVQETAIGAEIVSAEYVKIMEREEQDVVISSSCPAINRLIRKYYPESLKYLAPVETPMEVHCRMLRERYPDAFIVYLTPCYAEQSLAENSGCCDETILFSDLKSWLHESGVACVNRGLPALRGGMRARRYPRQDGIVKSFTRVQGWNRVSIDGVGDCIAALEELRQNGISRVFMEMTACEGSCVNGPAIRSNRYENRVRGTVAVNSYAGEQDFGIRVDEEEVERVLARLDKNTAETALNCGCCGYPTCREMARALLNGRAQMDMCLPYLREKAERHSRAVVGNTLEAADKLIEKQMRVAQNIASILGETTAETKVMLVKLKEAIQGDE